jgi:glucose dehydrogenase
MQPPWSRISGVDVVGRKIIWSWPLGYASDQGPFGIKTHRGHHSFGGQKGDSLVAFALPK